MLRPKGVKVDRALKPPTLGKVLIREGAYYIASPGAPGHSAAPFQVHSCCLDPSVTFSASMGLFLATAPHF